MKKPLRKVIFFCAILISGCASKPQTTEFTYLNETTFITKYNPHHLKLPLLLVLPEVGSSSITPNVLQRLARNYRVFYIPFLQSENRLRQMQLDQLNNRTNYYSDQLNLQTLTETDSFSVLAEGINANLISQIAHAFRIKHFISLNGYYPNLREVLTERCYIHPGFLCDSLAKHLHFNGKRDVDSLFVNVNQPKSDIQIGSHTVSVWLTFFDIPLQTQAHFTGKMSLVTTRNSGIAKPEEASVLKKDLKETLASLIRN